MAEDAHDDALSPGLAAAADFDSERREALLLPSDGGHCIGATLHLPGAAGPAAAGPAALAGLWSAAAKPDLSGDDAALPWPGPSGDAVLLLPGWSGPRTGPAELLVFLARRLTACGHTVLRIDFHGRGDSSGRFDDCDLDRMIGEAEIGLEFLRRRAPGARLVAGGICSGANVALGLAALRRQDVNAVLALSVLPFQPARTAAFDRRRRWKNLKALAAKAFHPRTWARLLRGEVNVRRVGQSLTVTERKDAGERNLKDSARDIEGELLSWKGRALFVWGGGDEEAPPARAHFTRLHAAGCGAEARFETVSAANHNFYRQTWRQELAARVESFLGAASPK